jgi:hypothetical protein
VWICFRCIRSQSTDGWCCSHPFHPSLPYHIIIVPPPFPIPYILYLFCFVFPSHESSVHFPYNRTQSTSYKTLNNKKEDHTRYNTRPASRDNKLNIACFTHLIRSSTNTTQLNKTRFPITNYPSGLFRMALYETDFTRRVKSSSSSQQQQHTTYPATPGASTSTSTPSASRYQPTTPKRGEDVFGEINMPTRTASPATRSKKARDYGDR